MTVPNNHIQVIAKDITLYSIPFYFFWEYSQINIDNIENSVYNEKSEDSQI